MEKKLKKKSLCKLDKSDANDNWAEIVDLVEKPKYLCERCLRAARLKGNLCKPRKLA